MLNKYVKNRIVRGILEWALCLAIAFLIFLVIDNFVMKSARVYGGSMEPTFGHHDRVIINRFVYLFWEPQAGDIIAFPYAADTSQHYIKRIIGVPGDVMDMRDGFVYRNGIRLDDEFSGDRVFSGTVFFPLHVEDDTFFVLGDNRQVSEDSRFSEVGNVPRRDIIGRITFRWLPFDRIGFVE